LIKKPIKLFLTFEYLCKYDIYKEGSKTSPISLLHNGKTDMIQIHILHYCSSIANNGLDIFEGFLLGHYDPSSTGRIQQLGYNTNHKQGVTKLLGNCLTSADYW